jgi:CBS domain-containing protein
MLNPTAPIHQFMTRASLTVTPETPLSDARLMMEDHRLRYLPVVSEGKVVGVLGAAADVVVDDFGLFTANDGVVRGAMTAGPACVPSGCPLRDVVHTMAHEDMTAVLIVDGDQLKGIFTDIDALKLLAMVLSE